MTAELRAVWAAFTAEVPSGGELRIHELGTRTQRGAMFAGRDAAGCHHILFPVPAPFDADRRSVGGHLVSRELVVAGRRILFADVACRSAALNPVFQRLAAEIHDGMAAQPDRALNVARAVLARWRELLGRDSAGLGADALAGLFGELWWLRKVVEVIWAYPSGAARWVTDMTSESTSVEVKTSTAREGRFVEVHGVEQLLPPSGGDLYLAFTRLERTRSGISAPDLVDGLIGAGVEAADVLALLTRVGWDRLDVGDYAGIRFEVREELLYPVDGDFPRLVPSTFVSGAVPLGVLNIRYTVDLTGPHPEPAPADVVATVVSRLAEG